MERDGRLDTLRGLALVVMTGAHVPFPVADAFFGWLGYATFAHVFVFLSGLVAGMVYAHIAPRSTAAQLWAKAMRRTGQIWVAHVAVVVFVACYLAALAAGGVDFTPDGARFLMERPAAGVALAGLLVYLPGYTHILAMYVIFVALLAPAALGALRGRPATVLIASAAVWAAAQFGLRDAASTLMGEVAHTHAGHFDVLGWQLLFVVGVVLGVARRRGSLGDLRLPGWLLVVMIGVHAALTGVRHGLVPGDASFGWLASDAALGPIRVLDFALVTALVAEGMRRWPDAGVVPWLALLGRNSMAVFIYHVVLVYALEPMRIGATWLHWPITAAVIASLTVPAWWARTRRSARAVCVAGLADGSCSPS